MTEKRMFSVSLITTGGVNEDMLAQVARVTRGADLRGVTLSSIDDNETPRKSAPRVTLAT